MALKQLEQAFERPDPFRAPSRGNSDHGIAMTQHGTADCLGRRTPVPVGEFACGRAYVFVKHECRSNCHMLCHRMVHQTRHSSLGKGRLNPSLFLAEGAEERGFPGSSDPLVHPLAQWAPIPSWASLPQTCCTVESRPHAKR